MRKSFLQNYVSRKVLEKWLGPSDNWEEQFDSIDMTNKKGEDAVLFVVIDQLTNLRRSEKLGLFCSLFCKEKGTTFLGLDDYE